MRLRPGTPVRSRYRARWCGIVLNELPRHAPDHCVVVLRTHDRNGRPMRRSDRFTIDPSWLVALKSLPVWPWWVPGGQCSVDAE